jgi:TM2 domain-containing membrane protein YozV
MTVAATCPYCRGPIEEDADAPKITCYGCGTPHHAECFEENGGCTVFGCSAAPAEEPKLSIAPAELNSAAPLQQASAAAPPPPPPPPFPAGYVAPAIRPSEPAADFIRYSPSNTLFVRSPEEQRRAVFTTAASVEMDSTPHAGAKNRTTFILLGVLLGFFGGHSFYAGYRGRGFLQLAITLGTLGIGGIAIWIWAIIDICTISRDSEGVNFRN